MAYTQITQLLVPYIHNGQPLIGGSAEFYVTGTTTPYVVYADNQGNGGASTRTFESDGTVLAYSDGTSDIKIIIRICVIHNVITTKYTKYIIQISISIRI